MGCSSTWGGEGGCYGMFVNLSVLLWDVRQPRGGGGGGGGGVCCYGMFVNLGGVCCYGMFVNLGAGGGGSMLLWDVLKLILMEQTSDKDLV